MCSNSTASSSRAGTRSFSSTTEQSGTQLSQTGCRTAPRPYPPPEGFTQCAILPKTRCSPVDEFGVPAGAPFTGTQTFTTANPELLNVTDNGDGSAVIAAVGGGALGPAGLTFTATPDGGGAPVVIEDTINVVAGLAEGFAATDSADVEVTPDVAP